MDINNILAELAKCPGYTENVGMVLTHKGVCRASTRADLSRAHSQVESISIQVDEKKLAQIALETEGLPGIFKALAFGKSGLYHPGDELLVLVVAGDIRENVIPAFSTFLDRVKTEAVCKNENLLPCP